MKHDFKEAFLRLAPQELRFERVSWVPVTGSTSDDMKSLVQKSFGGVFAVIGADRQTSGRGTHGRRWESAEESILMTVALPVPLFRMQGITLALGMSALSVLNERGIPAKLKWPNDLWLDSGKLGGILCEVVRSSDGIAHLVAGIGINVSISRKNFGRYGSSCISGVSGVAIGKITLAAEIAAMMTKTAIEFSPEIMKKVVQDWPGVDAFYGREVLWSDEGKEERKGRDDGIDEHGRLLLVSGGRVIALQSGSFTPL